MRLYLAGPMRGRPHYNFPAFAVAAAALRADGHTVQSPAEHDSDLGWSPFDGVEPEVDMLARMFRWDLGVLTSRQVDAVALLPGWTRSAGAKLEALVAQACGLPLYRFDLGYPAGVEFLPGTAREFAGGRGRSVDGRPVPRHLRRIHPPTIEIKFVGEELAGSADGWA